MRWPLLLLVFICGLTCSACSYSTDFVVINDSPQPIDVTYKVRRFPNEPADFTARPAKISASQVATRDKHQWRNLSPQEFQVNQTDRTVMVRVLPNEALWVTDMFHYIGDEDPNDVAEWPIEEIKIVGTNGSMTFTEQKSRQAFSYVSRVLYTLTYK